MKMSFSVDIEDEGAEGVSVAVYGDETEGLLFGRSGIETMPEALEYLKANLWGWIEDSSSR